MHAISIPKRPAIRYSCSTPRTARQTLRTSAAGIARTQGCQDHDDLYPCPQPRTKGGAQPAGREVKKSP